MSTLEYKRIILSALSKTKAPDYNPTDNLCFLVKLELQELARMYSNVRKRDEYILYDTLQMYFIEWEHYSGNKNFPIRSNLYDVKPLIQYRLFLKYKLLGLMRLKSEETIEIPDSDFLKFIEDYKNLRLNLAHFIMTSILTELGENTDVD